MIEVNDRYLEATYTFENAAVSARLATDMGLDGK